MADIEWYSYRFPVGWGGHQVWACSDCGAIVDDRALHQAYHERIEKK